MPGNSKVKIESTFIEWFAEVAAMMGVLISFAMPIYLWSSLPDTIPSHFGADGHADSYGGKGFLFFLPSVGMFFYMVLSLLNRYPYVLNYPWKITVINVYRQYQLAKGFINSIKAEMIWIFVYIEWIQIGVALGRAQSIHAVFLSVVITVILGTIAVYFYIAYHSR
ncbi:MAG: DUF1648 domain-containing protein [candidate division Zixibacteria bacterium]